VKRILTTLKQKWPEYILEIMVITIGILVAFTLNNWNQGRKEAVKERELLKSIRYSLGEAKQELTRISKSNQQRVESLEKLYKAAEKNMPYEEDMAGDFANVTGWANPFLKSTAYESLKNYGLEFISNKELRENLSDIYEKTFPRILDDYDKSEWVLLETVTYAFFVPRVNVGKDGHVPTDYSALVNDPSFKPIISRLLYVRKFGVQVCRNAIVKIDDTLKQLDQELEK